MLRNPILKLTQSTLRCGLTGTSRAFSTSGNLVNVEKVDQSIAVLTMNRAPVNSLNLELLNEMTEAIKSLESDKSCQGVVITSGTKNVFSAGLDLNEFYNRDDVEDIRNFWRGLQNMFMALYGSRLATVAAINGHSPAGGCLISISCDYRVGSDNEKYAIGLNEAAFGLVAPFWFIPPFENLVGPRLTERMLCRGEMVNFPKAVELGLIDEVVDHDKVLERSIQEATTMVKCAVPSSRVLTKMSLRGALINEVRERQEEDVEWFTATATSDRVQGMLHKYMESLKNKKK